MRSIYDWESWFFKLNELELNKSDIVCDRTIFTEIAIKAHNQAVENEELYEEKLEKWWYGSYLVDEYLKGIYGSNDKYEFAKSMRLQFMKATCKHPIEWDKRLFNCDKIEKDYREITNAVLNESIKNKLIKESEKSDIWEKGLSKVFKKNNFYFVNPIYFLNHLDKAGILEINPYKGKKLKEVTNTAYSTWLNYDGTDYDLTKEIESNPGFAPYDPDLYSEYGINGYACINTLFMEKMDYEQNGEKKKYSHEGIDFAGQRITNSKKDKKLRTPIHSFITGTVVKTGDHKTLNYGKHLIISDGNNRLFLLGHLYDYADEIKVGSRVFPGDTVAYVGNTGNCAGLSEEEKKDGSGTHLHLTVYMTEKAKFISNQPIAKMAQKLDKLLYSNSDRTYKTYSCEEYKNINPFNYEEKR